tara:strand:+ start:1102 stop:1353 length:252 start_codon:yes stop_codon:yes gene_type:complete
MTWEDVLKDQQSYDELLGLIERLEELIEKYHLDIEESAKEMSRVTTLPLENAMSIIRGIHKDTMKELEDTLREYREQLPQHVG